MANTRQYVLTSSGFVTVWYDNVIGCFTSSKDRDDFRDGLDAVCGPKEFNIAFKERDIYNMMTDGRIRKIQKAALPRPAILYQEKIQRFF